MKFDAFAVALWRTNLPPPNREAAIFKHWYDQLSRGRYIGPPLSHEIEVDGGRYVYQFFATTVLYFDHQLGKVKEGLPPLDQAGRTEPST